MAKDPPPDRDGQDMWSRVARSVRPLSPRHRARIGAEAASSHRLKSSHRSASQDGGQPLDEIRTNSTAPVNRPINRRGPTGGAAGPLDYREVRKIHRGRAVIDATLDLHGLNQAMAERRLQRFVEDAWHQGHRWLLVITGKGVAGQGVLRQALPEWLRQPPLNYYVLGIEPAHAAHGGGGAYYLRMRRAKG